MTADERMIAWLSGFFGALALLLAFVWLYGVMWGSVTQRRSEIGVRMALGAERANVMRLVLNEVLVLVGAGILIGIPVALAASRSIAGMLFSVAVTDPLTITVATTAFLLVALVAVYLPARQASRVDPISALKMD